LPSFSASPAASCATSTAHLGNQKQQRKFFKTNLNIFNAFSILEDHIFSQLLINGTKLTYNRLCGSFFLVFRFEL